MSLITNCGRARSALVAAIAATVGLSSPASAATMPKLTYDLRVHGTGAKSIDLTQTESVVIDLYAFVEGLDLNPNNDAVQSGMGSFVSSNGPAPASCGCRTARSTWAASRPGTPAPPGASK